MKILQDKVRIWGICPTSQDKAVRLRCFGVKGFSSEMINRAASFFARTRQQNPWTSGSFSAEAPPNALVSEMPEPLETFPRKERGEAIAAIHRKNPLLVFCWILPCAVGSALAGLSYDFCRDYWDADLLTTMPLLQLFWIGTSMMISNRYLYGPRLQKAAAKYFSQPPAKNPGH
jgi:hypothetical protein